MFCDIDRTNKLVYDRISKTTRAEIVNAEFITAKPLNLLTNFWNKRSLIIFLKWTCPRVDQLLMQACIIKKCDIFINALDKSCAAFFSEDLIQTLHIIVKLQGYDCRVIGTVQYLRSGELTIESTGTRLIDEYFRLPAVIPIKFDFLYHMKKYY